MATCDLPAATAEKSSEKSSENSSAAALHQLKEFDGKTLNSTTQAGLDIEDEEEKHMLEELTTEFVPLTKLVKKALGDNVEKVEISG